MKTKLALLASIAVTIATTHSLRADAVVYEGFGYASGQDITTVSTDATGLGNWTSTTGGIVGTTDSTGLTFGSLTTTGGSLDVTKPSGGGWQFLSAPIDTSISNGSTLYMSYLFQFVGPGGGLGDGDNFGVGVGSDTGANHTMAFLNHSYVSNPNGARINYGDGQGPQFNSGNIFDGSTYMFIAKWTNLGGASTATGWILNAADFSAIVAAGPVTDAALDANYMATATSNPGQFNAGTFDSTQFAKIGDFIDANINYRVDEVRFADNVADVAPVTAVPEPSTLAAFLVGSAGLLAFRRRR